ncbi:MAG: M48 family metallopeptidase [Pyrinomonadaceae bacterium]
MSKSRYSYLAGSLTVSLVVTLLLPTASIARTKSTSRVLLVSQGKQDKKEKSKEEAKKDDKAKLSKQERKYLEIMRFSKNRYDTNPDFREEVEEAYRRMQREHSEYAFLINIRDSADEQVTRSGDRVKIEDTLYDNPLAQDYVNRVGQSLVPQGSNKLYAFKITLNPIPEARSLSTGTVYLSTGLLSSVDNEAQLAYVLGHEVAHVEKEHWRDDVLVANGVDEWNEKQQQKRVVGGMAASIGLGLLSGGLLRSGNFGGAGAALAANSMVPTIFKLVIPNAVVSWERQQEDEADQLSLRYMLERKYDPREVPKFYAKLKGSTQRDKRAGLGFMANAARVAEREDFLVPAIVGLGSPSTMLFYGAVDLNMRQKLKGSLASAQPAAETKPDTGKSLDPSRNAESRATAAENTVSGELAAEIQRRLEAGDLVGTSAEFESVMGGMRRDNGIRAFYYDMFQTARDNLEESLRIRSNDPYTHFYYGKVLKLTARTLQEKSRAFGEFVQAIQYDKRRVLAEPYLYRALSMIDNKNPQMKEIVDNLKEYVGIYQREHGGALPPNMDVIYDYMQEAGETGWAAIPAMNVSTKNIDPIGVMSPAVIRTSANAMPPSTQPQTEQSSPEKKRGVRRP